MEYRLVQEMKAFTRLCYLWRQDSRHVPCDLSECWGPPEHKMLVSAALEYTSQVDFSVYEDGPEEWSADEHEEEAYEDDELYAQMETMALRDEYSHGARHSVLTNEDHYSSDDSMPDLPTRKRSRHK